ncbi:MAG: hypothetical protein WC916_00060 [Candidatus Woesearchaeota archaeon]
MSTIFLSPEWFFKYNILFEIFFLIISLIIATFALKVYRTTGQKLAKYFGYGFLLISIAFLTQSVSTFFVLTKINTQLCAAMQASSVASIDAAGTYLYMGFMIAGIVTILFVSLKSNTTRTLWLLLAASLIAIALSRNPIYTFYLLASIYLAFITGHFIAYYLKNKKIKTLLVALAFLFLWFGTFHFLISVNREIFYVIGYVLELIAYLLILSNWIILRK